MAVRFGSGFAVRAAGPRADLDTVERDGATLKVRLKTSGGIALGSNHNPVKVVVTMQHVASAEVAGSGDVTIDRVTGAVFDASAAAGATSRLPR